MIDEQLASALRAAMDQSITENQIYEVYHRFEGAGKRLVTYGKRKVIVHTEDAVERILLLLSGSCNVLSHSDDGRIVMAGEVAAPQIFGLYELLSGLPYHTADVETETPCTFFAISPRLYREQYDISMDVMRFSANYLVEFIQRLLGRSDRMTLYNNRQSLLLYCLDACKDNQLPVVLYVRKEALAAELNMNVRTLYRQIGQLRDEGLIGSYKGKISIDRNQMERIYKEIYTG